MRPWQTSGDPPEGYQDVWGGYTTAQLRREASDGD